MSLINAQTTASSHMPWLGQMWYRIWLHCQSPPQRSKRHAFAKWLLINYNFNDLISPAKGKDRIFLSYREHVGLRKSNVLVNPNLYTIRKQQALTDRYSVAPRARWSILLKIQSNQFFHLVIHQITWQL